MNSTVYITLTSADEIPITITVPDTQIVFMAAAIKQMIPSVTINRSMVRAGRTGRQVTVLGVDPRARANEAIRQGDIFSSASDLARSIGVTPAACSQALKSQDLGGRVPYAAVVRGILFCYTDRIPFEYRNPPAGKEVDYAQHIQFKYNLPFQPGTVNKVEAEMRDEEKQEDSVRRALNPEIGLPTGAHLPGPGISGPVFRAPAVAATPLPAEVPIKAPEHQFHDFGGNDTSISKL